MNPLHMGALHPVEQLLTLLLAFGPFVVLGAVIWWRRRADERSERSSHEQSDVERVQPDR